MSADLGRWIKAATEGLAEFSREEIRREITSHYEEARQGHVGDGLDDASAHAAALADLGDPAAANRGFRRSHFTEKEWKLVVGLSRTRFVLRPVPSVLAGLFTGAWFVAYAEFFHRWDVWWIFPAFVVYAPVAWGLRQWALRGFGVRASIAVLVFNMLSWQCLGFYLGTIPHDAREWIGSAAGLLFAVGFSYFFWVRRVYSGIWRKAWRLKGRLPLAE